MRNDIIAIICPDVHGRKFWEKLLEEYDGSVPCIFLGDYLDPYPNENISVEDAKKNFEKIWEFKEKWTDKVILLFGNHDLSYYDRYFRCCRYSSYYHKWYNDFLTRNEDNFKIVHEIENNGKKILFSHSGINPSWIKENNFEDNFSADYINSLFHTNRETFNQYSYYRGGYMNAGSPVWADIREYLNLDDKDYKSDIIQIVGHTQLINDTFNIKNITCVDSRQLFVLTNENTIEKY